MNPRDCWHEPYWIESPSGQMIYNPKCSITPEQYHKYYVGKETDGMMK